jgi:hypothetical protein
MVLTPPKGQQRKRVKQPQGQPDPGEFIIDPVWKQALGDCLQLHFDSAI